VYNTLRTHLKAQALKIPYPAYKHHPKYKSSGLLEAILKQATESELPTELVSGCIIYRGTDCDVRPQWTRKVVHQEWRVLSGRVAQVKKKHIYGVWKL
jgi:hypothetical protein